jgi:hypothetical protein
MVSYMDVKYVLNLAAQHVWYVLAHNPRVIEVEHNSDPGITACFYKLKPFSGRRNMLPRVINQSVQRFNAKANTGPFQGFSGSA